MREELVVVVVVMVEVLLLLHHLWQTGHYQYGPLTKVNITCMILIVFDKITWNVEHWCHYSGLS